MSRLQYQTVRDPLIRTPYGDSMEPFDQIRSTRRARTHHVASEITTCREFKKDMSDDDLFETPPMIEVLDQNQTADEL